MSDRLEDLKRHRARAQEQLEWFDREIARETGVAPQPAAFATPATTTPLAPADAKDQAAIDKEAAAILERFRQVQHPVRDEVKRGCLIYFVCAVLVLITGLVAFYFLKKNGFILTPPPVP